MGRDPGKPHRRHRPKDAWYKGFLLEEHKRTAKTPRRHLGKLMHSFKSICVYWGTGGKKAPLEIQGKGMPQKRLKRP